MSTLDLIRIIAIATVFMKLIPDLFMSGLLFNRWQEADPALWRSKGSPAAAATRNGKETRALVSLFLSKVMLNHRDPKLRWLARYYAISFCYTGVAILTILVTLLIQWNIGTH